MDCEKFDLYVMDALYDELDEVTFAAMKRHMDGCSRCASAFSRLRATRDVGVLPLEEPSDELEGRILSAVSSAQRKASWPRKALRGLAWAGSHAMRPQLAMAALFVLVIGSSLLLLRPKPASMPTPVRVTERGVPALEPAQSESMAATPTPAAQAPVMAAPTAFDGALSGKAMADAKGKRAEESDSAAEAAGSGNDAKSALADARGVRQKAGCGAAVKAYNEVGTRFPATVSAADAMWEAAECYKAMGEEAKARELYLSLRSYSSYRDRADQELVGVASSNMNNQMAARAAGGGSMPKSAAAAPAPPVAKPAAAAQAMEAPITSPPAKAGGAPGPSRPAAPERSKAADAYGF